MLYTRFIDKSSWHGDKYVNIILYLEVKSMHIKNK